MKKKVEIPADSQMANAIQNPQIVKEMDELLEKKRQRKYFVCGNCANCPQYPKTFCKTTKHQVTLTTPSADCKHFVQKEA